MIPNAIAVFERYAGPEYKHHEILAIKMPVKPAVNLWCAGLVRLETTIICLTGICPKWCSGINAGATGIEAVKGVKSRTMHDSTAKRHQIWNFN